MEGNFHIIIPTTPPNQRIPETGTAPNAPARNLGVLHVLRNTGIATVLDFNITQHSISTKKKQNEDQIVPTGCDDEDEESDEITLSEFYGYVPSF